MKILRCSTQDELEKALASESPVDIWLVGAGSFWISGSSQVTASGSSQVTAYGSSQVTASGSSQVRAYGSSQVRAYDSSQVTASGSSQVTAYGSSQVTAYGSSQVRAYDSSQVRAYDSSQVTASTFVAVTRHAKTVKVDGGVLVDIPPIASVAAWCDYYGLSVVDGIVTLYKGLDAQFRSEHGYDYTPGTIPVAADWDGGRAECGGGLHFSPRPINTLRFAQSAVKFVACPVAVTDMRVPKEGDTYPEKVKARGCCGPVYEVTIYGERVKEREK